MTEPIFDVTAVVKKHFIKKNSRNIRIHKPTGRMFPGKNSELLAGEYNLIRQFSPKRPEKMIKFPVRAQFDFYFPMSVMFCQSGPNKGNFSGKLPDLSNLYQLPEDCLQQARIIENDQLICSHDGSRRLLGQSYMLRVRLYRFESDPAESF